MVRLEPIVRLLHEVVPEAQVTGATFYEYTNGHCYLFVHSHLPFFWHYFETKYPHCKEVEGYSAWTSWGPVFTSKMYLIHWLCRVLKLPDSVTNLLSLTV